MPGSVNLDHPFATARGGQRPIVPTRDRSEALALLSEGLGAREPFLVVSGEAGTGKTTLILEAIQAWGARAIVSFVANPALTRNELVEEIAIRFGAEPPREASKPQLLACIERVLAEAASRGQVAVIVLDDAHDLVPDLLEELRLLANSAQQSGHPIEIALVGLPVLEARLGEPAFAPLQQRIGARCRLQPFSNKDTRRFLHAVIAAAGGNGPAVFPRDTCREIHQRTRGVPRAIRALAAEALTLARAAGESVVGAGHVRLAAAALWVGVAGAEPVDTAASPAAPAARDQASRPPAVAPRPAAVAPATSAAPAATDERTRDWVGRFIAEDEPRFGSFLTAKMNGAPGGWPADEAGESDVAASAHPSTPGIATARAPFATADEPPSDPAPLDDMTAWSVRRHTPDRPRRGYRRRGGSAAFPIAAGIVLLAVAIVLLPRGRRPSDGAPRTVTRAAAATAAPEPGSAATAGAQDHSRGPSSNRSHEASDAGAARPAAKARDERRAVASNEAPSRAAEAAPTAGAERIPAERPPASEPTPAAAPPIQPSTGAAPESAPPSAFVMDVGAYLNPDRARTERDRLAADTGLDVWVVTAPDHGVEMHRVLIGTFDTRERAETSAMSLMQRGLVQEAQVVSVPQRARR